MLFFFWLKKTLKWGYSCSQTSGQYLLFIVASEAGNNSDPGLTSRCLINIDDSICV